MDSFKGENSRTLPPLKQNPYKFLDLLSQSPDPLFPHRVPAASLQSLKSALAPHPASNDDDHEDRDLPLPPHTHTCCACLVSAELLGPQGKKDESNRYLTLVPSRSDDTPYPLLCLSQRQLCAHTILLLPGLAEPMESLLLIYLI